MGTVKSSVVTGKHAPIQVALAAELHALDVFMARVWLVFGVLGVLASLVFAVFVSRALGIACLVVVVPYLLWYVYLYRRLLDGPITPGNKLVTTSLEIALPLVFFLALLMIQGPGYALASWVPPMMYSLVTFAFTLRLRTREAIVCGFVVAIGYGTLYFAYAGPALSPELASMVLYQPPMQISRIVSMVAAGAMAALAGKGLREAIGRAEVVVRERDLFGKYRIVREVAKGGMARVFDALYCPEGGFERRVAIKRIHSHLAEKERFVRFFRSEAEISARLGHPNIVQVMDFGRVDGNYYLAMEYVDGLTMAELLRVLRARGERLPVGFVGAIAREVLAGLHHAHEGARGVDGKVLRVVHRDLCPQNVMLSKNGEVKITDFGVARALRDSAVSQSKTLVGHLGYIAPEQARGHGVDTRSDLFAVGVILWELLAGRSLFGRDNDAATLGALLYDPVPPIALIRDDVDPAWDTFLAEALEREPGVRFASASDMADALAEVPGATEPGSLSALAELVREVADAGPAEAVAEAQQAPTLVESEETPTVVA